MKNLYKILENKFLIKKNITKDDNNIENTFGQLLCWIIGLKSIKDLLDLSMTECVKYGIKEQFIKNKLIKDVFETTSFIKKHVNDGIILVATGLNSNGLYNIRIKFDKYDAAFQCERNFNSKDYGIKKYIEDNNL